MSENNGRTEEKRTDEHQNPKINGSMEDTKKCSTKKLLQSTCNHNIHHEERKRGLDGGKEKK